jgi:hypothetical protein
VSVSATISKRKMCRTRKRNSWSDDEPTPGTTANNESDSNADTCCLGANFVVVNRTERSADVYPYDESYEPLQNVPIVTGATAWDDADGTTYILIVNEALYYGKKLRHTLLNPNQLRAHGTMFWDNPYDTTRDLCIEPVENVVIPLVFKGTKLIFESRAPNDDELSNYLHIHLTSSRKWEPSEVRLGEVTTEVVNDFNIQKVDVGYQTNNPYSFAEINDYRYEDRSSTEAILHNIDPCLTHMKERMVANMNSIPMPISLPSNDDDLPARRTYVSTERHNKVSAEKLADLWGIGLKRAHATMRATTQRGVRSAILPLSRRYRADRAYNVKRLESRFATDTLWAEEKSLNQNKCAQIYSSKNGFAACYPMTRATGSEIGQSLNDFIHDFGAPSHLTFDGAQAQVGSKTMFMKTIRRYDIRFHVSSPRRPNENPVEGSIREIKKRWYRIMMRRKVPKRLWDYGLVWICETGNLSVSSSRYANGRTAIEMITGDTPDISEYTDFGFYDWIVYNNNAGLGTNHFGRWLGVSHKVGQLMSYWIITIRGDVISCTTVQRLTNIEQMTDSCQKEMNEYDKAIEERLNISGDTSVGIPPTTGRWNKLSTDDDPEFIDEFRNVIDNHLVKGGDDDTRNPDDHTPDSFDGYINVEIGLPRGADGELIHAKVKRRAVDVNGDPVGVSNNNPLLDSRVYEVEYFDGETEHLSANVIAENMLAQVGEDGHRQLMLDEIIEHRCNDDAIPRSRGLIKTPNGTLRKVRTTKGWELCVQWKDGSTNWATLKDLKDSYPVQLAEYAVNNKIETEPAFAWWVPYTLKKRSSIIAKLKSKYWQRTHKYGIRVPKSIKEAYEIDQKEGNSLWRDAVMGEMKKIRNAFQRYDSEPTKLIGYQEITTHWIFDIKLGENFRRKARLVGDGHKTKTPSSVTYSSVVSRESVRLCLLLAALNELDVQAADIENAYLTAPCREKCWTRGGKEFGSEESCVFIITKALYGLKSSGAAFRSFLAETLDKMGFQSTLADPDVWIRPAAKPDGEEYYEYLLCYVDDILCVSMKAKAVIGEIAQSFKLKNNDISPPDIYLGARLKEKNLGGRNMWTMSSNDYIKSAVKNLEERLAKDGNKKLPNKAVSPMMTNYIPEFDETQELNTSGITMYQELIGILRWAIEIGRVDIVTEVSMMSAYQASPREGHLEQLLHIFGYLKKKPNLTLYFDPTLPNLDGCDFNIYRVESFQDYYRGAVEEVPPRMPKPRGRCITTTAFVDASHASNKVTRRSHTGFVIFVNRSPITWYSKRQNTIESSTFSSEFVAMKICVENITALRYKLRMFGVPVDEPTVVLCDNEAVVNNSSKVESTLNKKHSSIAYHAVRWAVAAEIIKVGKVHTDRNIADALTKRLTVNKRNELYSMWTY